MFSIDKNIKILSATLEKIADNVMITDINGVIKYVNPAFETTTGYSCQEALGQTPKILRSGRQSAEYYQKLWDTILAGKVFRATVTNKRKNGNIFYSDQTITPILSDSGEIICFVSVWKDVTERMEFEEKLTIINDQLIFEKKKLEEVLGIEGGLHRILDLNKLIDFVVEKTCVVLDAGKCSVMFVDYESGELCIKGHHGIEGSLVTGGNFPKVGDQIEVLIERYHKTKGKVQSSQIIDGSIYQSDLFLSVPIRMKDRLLGIINVSDKKGRDGIYFTDLDLKVLSMIVNQVRIAVENAKFYQELKYLTVTDPLTGLYNHRYFNKAMDYEIMRAKRYKRDLSFLMIDVDHFKMYNDVFGHLEGDRLRQREEARQ
jgi:PAS domain S-box-containing protein